MRPHVVFVFLLVCTVSTIIAKSINSTEASTDYFQDALEQLDQVRYIPFVGDLVSRYVIGAQNFVRSLEVVSEGSLSSMVNSVMPCGVNGTRVVCEGSLDRSSARKFVRTVLNQIPDDALSPSLFSILRIAQNLI